MAVRLTICLTALWVSYLILHTYMPNDNTVFRCNYNVPRHAIVIYLLCKLSLTICWGLWWVMKVS